MKTDQLWQNRILVQLIGLHFEQVRNLPADPLVHEGTPLMQKHVLVVR